MKTRDGKKMTNGMTVYAIKNGEIVTGTVNTEGIMKKIEWSVDNSNLDLSPFDAYSTRESAAAGVKKNTKSFTDDGDAGRDLDSEISYITSGREKRNFGC
jgi:hypothetical protein